MDILRNVPKEERKKIVLAVKKVDKHKFSLSLPRTEIEYLFEIWNTYVQPSNKQDITCRGCVINVFSQFKHYIGSWKEHAESL
jgi:hypothetical protein